jgi:hypothetical protein
LRKDPVEASGRALTPDWRSRVRASPLLQGYTPLDVSELVRGLRVTYDGTYAIRLTRFICNRCISVRRPTGRYGMATYCTQRVLSDSMYLVGSVTKWMAVTYTFITLVIG